MLSGVQILNDTTVNLLVFGFLHKYFIIQISWMNINGKFRYFSPKFVITIFLKIITDDGVTCMRHMPHLRKIY